MALKMEGQGIAKKDLDAVSKYSREQTAKLPDGEENRVTFAKNS